MKSFLYLAACTGGLVGLAGTARSYTILESLAWTATYSPGVAQVDGTLALDAAGNTYSISGTGGGSNGVDIIRLDPTGKTTLSKHINFGTPAPTRVFIKPIPHTNAMPDIYVAVGLQNTSAGAYVAKFDSAGNTLWTHLLGDSTSPKALVGWDIDNSGVSYLAMQYSTSTYSDVGVDMDQLSSAGTLLKDVSFVGRPYPTVAGHVKSGWIVVGGLPGSTETDLVDQNNGNVLLNLDSKEHDSIQTFVQPDGTFYLADNFDETTNGVNDAKFVLYHYDGQGRFLWSSRINDHNVAEALGQGDQVYVVTSDYSNVFPPVFQLSTIDHNGFVGNTASAVAFHLLGAGPSGVYVTSAAQPNPNTRTIELDKFDPALNKVYSDVGDPIGRAYVGVDNNDFLTVFGSTGGNNQTNFVAHFVPGVTLSQITPSASTVKGGSTVTLKVQLNSAAQAGGIMVNLTSDSPKMLFSNGTESINVAIPNGSTYALVNVTTGTVSANTVVNIKGVQGSLSRTTSVTITP